MREGQKYLLDYTITDVLSVTKTSAKSSLRPTQEVRNPCESADLSGLV